MLPKLLALELAGVAELIVGVPNPVLLLELVEVVVLGAFGGGPETVGGLFAASNALALKSLSLPANIIPDKVPVKNVAIGIINSKNFWSIGEIAFNGCVTKIIE